MKRYAFATLLLIMLSTGITFADDPWGPKKVSPQNGYTLTNFISDAWQVILRYI